ncbi:putative 26.2 kDa heat shock protein, mitochondrial [Iris pallida]|uniref:26.2 kDa heat shock protein, mitochondrial n=1 Tax=Iris pallida TaxID=29817 RepID=A0AAX6GKZ7_IRIPA|nr:putative 26.2 kDa heat shock protein, mitochondrial [Iris pallida]
MTPFIGALFLVGFVMRPGSERDRVAPSSSTPTALLTLTFLLRSPLSATSTPPPVWCGPNQAHANLKPGKREGCSDLVGTERWETLIHYVLHKWNSFVIVDQ